MNHTNKPPPFQQAEVPSGKDAFKLIANIVLIAVGGLSVFWTLAVRKFGTIGTRACSK